MDLYELGERVREARIAANKTQQDVAKSVGTSKARISLLESAQLPGLSILRLLSVFDAVGLELLARPLGHSRTLDDVLAEQRAASLPVQKARQRVRRPRLRTGSGTRSDD